MWIKGADFFYFYYNAVMFRPSLALCKKEKVVYYIKFVPCIQISHDIKKNKCYLLLMNAMLTIIKGDTAFFFLFLMDAV